MRLFVFSKKEYAGGERTYEMLVKDTTQIVANMQITFKDPEMETGLILGQEYEIEFKRSKNNGR